jgi:hypothetical protein
MKDALGHGSNPRGGQQAASAWRAAHQGATYKAVPSVAETVKKFASDTSGQGRAPDFMHEAAFKAHDPELMGRLATDLAESIAEGRPSAGAIIHLAHFLG